MQVLIAARGGDVRVRRRALAVTHGVVGALREEYALLLPESLPFLAELLEDEDAGVHSIRPLFRPANAMQGLEFACADVCTPSAIRRCLCSIAFVSTGPSDSSHKKKIKKNQQLFSATISKNI